MNELPSIKASDLAELSAQFAKDLAARLEEIDRQYPSPQMSQEGQSRLEHISGADIPGPKTQEYLRAFESLFWQYMASRYVILPA
jgi:hypothetical protein